MLGFWMLLCLWLCVWLLKTTVVDGLVAVGCKLQTVHVFFCFVVDRSGTQGKNEGRKLFGHESHTNYVVREHAHVWSFTCLFIPSRKSQTLTLPQADPVVTYIFQILNPIVSPKRTKQFRYMSLFSTNKNSTLHVLTLTKIQERCSKSRSRGINLPESATRAEKARSCQRAEGSPDWWSE